MHCSLDISKMIKLTFVFCLIGILEIVKCQTTPANVFVENVCICVTQNYCGIAGGGGGNTDGAGNIDPRIMTVYCAINCHFKNLQLLFT